MIDAGNSDYRDTMRRLKALGPNDPTFVGMGVSGGAEGARNGPSMMVGGTQEAYDRIAPILWLRLQNIKANLAVRWLARMAQAIS